MLVTANGSGAVAPDPQQQGEPCMKKRLPTIILILVFFAGLSLLLYPTVSDRLNSLHQTRAISDYAQTVADLDNNVYEQYLSDAEEYNRALAARSNRFSLSKAEIGEYNALLNLSKTGVMGYIEIPEIKVSLPIYHGTNDSVLAIAIGHIAGSSLPVGGESSHCVLSGHRGLPSARLFTDLDKMSEGDIFMLRTLDETLTYEVDQIRIVEPAEVENLAIEDGKDYCTLVTCTPYGINTHRLLVRGHRIENKPESQAARVTSDALQIDPMLVAPVFALPILLLLLIFLFVRSEKKKPNKR